jgi:hypothetical protein
MLTKAAFQVWGIEGWSFVADKTIVGFHAANRDGEVIEAEME